jgi:hypothetical protein
VGSLNIKGSTISHMAAVHPGALATGSPQKEERLTHRTFVTSSYKLKNMYCKTM